jgi:hypothetical protein
MELDGPALSEFLGIEQDVCEYARESVLIVFHELWKHGIKVLVELDLEICHLRLDDPKDVIEALFEVKRPEIDLQRPALNLLIVLFKFEMV